MMLNSDATAGTETRAHWAVVGGGMLGIALARRLTEQGQKVTLIEARSSLGGLADAWQLGDIVWDRHYHVIALSDAALRAELDSLGLTDEIRWVETKTGFYTGGKFYSMSSAIEFLRFPPLRLIEKLRLGFTIFYASKIRNWERLENLLVAQWLERWSGKSTFQKIWLPLLRAKLGDAYERTAASFIWAYISRMYRARRTGLKKEMFGYVRGGYARILERCSQSLTQSGAQIQLGDPVQSVRSLDGGGVKMTYTSGKSASFDQVLIATAAPIVADLCPQLSESEKVAFRNIEYLGIVCASLLIDRPLRGYYVTNITDEVPFTAVIEASTIIASEECGGKTLVYLPKYVAQGDPAITATDEEIRRQFLERFFQMYPELDESNVSAFRISRVRYVTSIPTLNYSKKLPPVRTTVPGVHAISSALITQDVLNVNETLRVADQRFRDVVQPIIDAGAATLADSSSRSPS